MKNITRQCRNENKNTTKHGKNNEKNTTTQCRNANKNTTKQYKNNEKTPQNNVSIKKHHNTM
jgi:hypothetical protein